MADGAEIATRIRMLRALLSASALVPVRIEYGRLRLSTIHRIIAACPTIEQDANPFGGGLPMLELDDAPLVCRLVYGDGHTVPIVDGCAPPSPKRHSGTSPISPSASSSARLR